MGSTHNHYQLEVEGLAAELDVLSFKGEEWLSHEICTSDHGRHPLACSSVARISNCPRRWANEVPSFLDPAAQQVLSSL
jgi:hypothetical protein